MNHIKRGRPTTNTLRPNETLEQRLKKRSKWLNYYYSLTPLEAWIRAALNNSKRRARRLGVEHSLTADQIRAIVPNDLLCPILGLPLEINHHKGAVTPMSATIDRINPKGHYTKDNVHIISQLANRGKCHMDLLQLTKLGQWAEKVLKDK